MLIITRAICENNNIINAIIQYCDCPDHNNKRGGDYAMVLSLNNNTGIEGLPLSRKTNDVDSAHIHWNEPYIYLREG